VQALSFSVDGTDHLVVIEPENRLKGWPDAFSCDGVRYPIKIPVSLTAIRFEQPFEIGGHPATLVMSKARRRDAWWGRFKAALWMGLTGRNYRAAEAANAVDPWKYEVLVGGQRVAPRA
jgi:hypothetical protein